MKKKISFLAWMDYANVLTNVSSLVNKYSDEYESMVICITPHTFRYSLTHDIDLNESNKDKAESWINESTHIIFGEELGFGEYLTLKMFKNKLNINIDDKKIIVWYPGSHYRHYYQKFNSNIETQTFYKRIYAMDLYRLSPKTHKDTVMLAFNEFHLNEDEYYELALKKILNHNKIISHYPSDVNKKGTSIINDALSKIDLNSLGISYSVGTGISHSDVMNKMKRSLFYIDQFGDISTFGIASIEAMMRGNVVMSSIDNTEEGLRKLNKELEVPVINLGKNTNLLQDKITEVITYDTETLLKRIDLNFKFLKNNYCGENIVKRFECDIL